MSEVWEPRHKLIIRKQDRMDYIIDGVCRFYDIPITELVKRKATSVATYKHKRIAVKLLRDVADCSFKDIQYNFDRGNEQGVWQIYQRITEDLESGYSSNKELKKEYAEILKFLGL